MRLYFYSVIPTLCTTLDIGCPPADKYFCFKSALTSQHVFVFEAVAMAGAAAARHCLIPYCCCHADCSSQINAALDMLRLLVDKNLHLWLVTGASLFLTMAASRLQSSTSLPAAHAFFFFQALVFRRPSECFNFSSVLWSWGLPRVRQKMSYFGGFDAPQSWAICVPVSCQPHTN